VEKTLMKNMLCRMVALAAGALLLGTNSVNGDEPFTAPDKTGAGRKVDCSIAPIKPQFRVGEPVLMSVALHNVSDVPVSVAFLGRTNECPIINFRMHGPDGQKLFVSTKQNLWCGTGIVNRPFPAKHEHRVSVDLLKTWEWGGVQTKLLPGAYTISAEVFSTTPDGGSPKVGQSGRAEFTITAGQ